MSFLWIDDKYVLKFKNNFHNHHIKIAGQDINPFEVHSVFRKNYLFTNKEMKKDYIENGRCLYVTISVLTKYKMLYFSGLDRDRNITIFAMSLYELMTKNRIFAHIS